MIALNPGLDCSALEPGQLVCTGTGGAPTATCGFRCGPTDQGRYPDTSFTASGEALPLHTAPPPSRRYMLKSPSDADKTHDRTFEVLAPTPRSSADVL